VGAKSIDEFVLDLTGSPARQRGMHTIAEEIETRIRHEIGEWLSVSIGIAPNRFLAKTAAGLHKPDGLDEINHTNYIATYCDLELTDLCGISHGYACRLNQAGFFTVVDVYEAAPWELKAAFGSIVGHYWYYRLRGWEIDDVEFRRKSFGHSYSLPKPLTSTDELAPILHKLVEKMGARLRRAGYRTQGVHVCVAYRDHDYWHQSIKLARTIFDSRDLYREAYHLLCRAPLRKPVRNLAVSCFNLSRRDAIQLELFDDVEKQERLVDALDSINERWGNFAITPARMLGTEDQVIDRISFGSIKELEEEILAPA
jgi:DNA polymerase-4